MKAMKHGYHRQDFVEDSQGNEFEIPYEPTDVDDVDILVSEDGKRALVSYLVQDTTFQDDGEDDYSEIVILQRDYKNRGDEHKFAAALGLECDGWRTLHKPDPEDYDDPEDMPKADPDAMMLDVHVHGGAKIALSGSLEASRFSDRRWDVSKGVWIPGKELKAELEKLDPEERAKRRMEVAEAAIEYWNSLACGDVWGCILVAYNAVFDGDTGEFVAWETAGDVFGWVSSDGKGIQCASQEVWGYVGLKYAQEELDGWVKEYTEKFLQQSGAIDAEV